MSAKTLSFESRMERLRIVVGELEKGDLPLEKSVALYKEGRALAAACREQLEKARHEVKLHAESGLTDFEAEAEDEKNG